MENAKQIIAEVTDKTDQRSASKKDEVIIMKAMLNDPNFCVGIYDKTGKVGEYNPSQEVRKMVSNIVTATTKIPGAEARGLVDMYEFTKSDANVFINLSKEFVNTYLHTGRKLPLGGRINSDIKLEWKNIEERKVQTPKKDSTERVETTVPAHGGIHAINPCPSWVK